MTSDEHELHSQLKITRRRRMVARNVPVSRPGQTVNWPNVMARLKEDFGGKVTPDSAPLFDDMRGER